MNLKIISYFTHSVWFIFKYDWNWLLILSCFILDKQMYIEGHKIKMIYLFRCELSFSLSLHWLVSNDSLSVLFWACTWIHFFFIKILRQYVFNFDLLFLVHIFNFEAQRSSPELPLILMLPFSDFTLNHVSKDFQVGTKLSPFLQIVGSCYSQRDLLPSSDIIALNS